MPIRTRAVPVTAAALVTALLAAVLLAVPAPPAAAQGAADLAIIKDSEAPSNAEIAARLSEGTDLAGTIPTVVITRDDGFADALASGLLQGRSPLLLVPSQGPVPDRVLSEIRRLGAGDAVILGGTAAVAQAVADQLAAEGLDVSRRQGGSRIETAIDIAATDAPAATTAILARAFPTNPADPTQGFADALGAGAMAAEHEWPILLSDTASLTPATAAYLADSDIREVKIIGGTAALSADVEAAINGLDITTERIAGPSRGATALEVGKATHGADTAADVAHLILADGTGPDAWAGGFASARRSALLDAPILLADGVRLLPETTEFLEPGAAFAQSGDLTVTCVVHPLACVEGRRALGLEDLPILDVAPLPNSFVQAGQTVELILGPAAEGAGQEIEVKGSCIDDTVLLTTGSDGRTRVALSPSLPRTGTCTMQVVYGGVDGITQGFSYVLDPTVEARQPGVLQVASDVFGYGSVVPDEPLYVSDRIVCDGPAGVIDVRSSAYQARLLQDDFSTLDYNLTSIPVDVFPDDVCTVTADLPSGVNNPLWGVYAWSDPSLRRPLLLGHGQEASFTFDDLAGGATDVVVVWLLRTDGAAVTSPPAATDPAVAGAVFNQASVGVTCDGIVIPDDYSFQQPGARCEASSSGSGLQLFVVEPDRPLVLSDTVTFSPRSTVEPVAVYAVGATSTTGGTSCASAPELPWSFLTYGMTTPSQPVAYHSFPAFAGEALRFRVDNLFGDFVTGIDPILTLFGPDGSVVAVNDDGDTAYNSRIDLPAAQEGVYCLEVSGYGGSVGDYLITADPAPTLTDVGELSASTPTRRYDHNATAGELIILELRAPGFATTDPLLRVTLPDGRVIEDDDGGGALNSRIELEVPVTGPIVIEAAVFGTSYGPYQLEASFVPPSSFTGPAPRAR